MGPKMRLRVVPRDRGQKRAHSFLEASANVALGIAINVAVLHYIVHASAAMNVSVTALMTGMSFLRQYSVRRLFNCFH